MVRKHVSSIRYNLIAVFRGDGAGVSADSVFVMEADYIDFRFCVDGQSLKWVRFVFACRSPLAVMAFIMSASGVSLIGDRYFAMER